MKHNTYNSLDDGQPLVEVAGFAPLKPAELMAPARAILQSNVGIANKGGVLRGNAG